MYTRTIRPRKKYEESVRKHEWMLRKELQSEDSVAFFIDEKEVESISIITRNFFISVHQFIYPLEDIKRLGFRPDRENQSHAGLGHTPYGRLMLKHSYKADFQIAGSFAFSDITWQ